MLPYCPPTEPLLDIVHQDADVLVLNKPSGLLSVPGRRPEYQDSLQSRAQQQLPGSLTVHRLDMETSGLVVMAMNKPAQAHLSQQFAQRQTQKSYVARVYGHPAEAAGVVELPLICDWPNRPKQKVDQTHGKAATTHWRVLITEPETTVLELKPITGRSHQLRVHMLALGLPIVGDQLYATGAALAWAERLHLHSHQLGFSHPATKQPMQFEAPLPF
ncbi:RluA family pseudouridine synthase [Marinicella meishanensis]|uniref:RluA family pseudouridine synthase n=1 Tax=Marinicella meishanensis TaxID=2873263 RepID=UPI001CC03578|nr:RluA family pseudouridine synthase [Marinicella sp. NBU2979]